MSHFLKRFELKVISKAAVEAINERKNNPAMDKLTNQPLPATVTLEAEIVLLMLREIEHRRQQSYINWCKHMAAQKKEQK